MKTIKLISAENVIPSSLDMQVEINGKLTEIAVRFTEDGHIRFLSWDYKAVADNFSHPFED